MNGKDYYCPECKLGERIVKTAGPYRQERACSNKHCNGTMVLVQENGLIGFLKGEG